MADTKPLAPTDAEIDALWVGQQLTVPQLVQRRVIARAALAKWGTPQQEAQEPVAWYVTVCSRLLDEDEANAEARHIGGTARAIPLYTAPQADSVQDLQPAHDAVTIDLLNERVAHLERKLKEADSVLEDAARWQELREQHESDEDLCCVFAPNDMRECLVPVGSFPGELDAFMDAERAARKQGGAT